ncbi:DMT family transporter [Methylobacterium sp. WL120]|uniref:DMT family transporter n=1 Tax=Methylobacterium sp. WL120 TaxID=2603887 RepID=UPI0011CB0A21|nr:DMT family transporter [Methylobacterium sp. WL120]TXM64871.1 DMT family transporter [Methylobacterium sp. WL120]
MPALLANVLIPGLFVLIWATGFIAARFVAPHAQPLPFVALRVMGVALVLAAIALALRARWPRTGAGWRNAIVAGVLMQGCYIVGVFWAIHRGLPAGIAALVGSLQPLATAMLAGPVLGEAVSRRRWFGIGIGFLGAGLVLAPKIGAADPAGIPPVALAACAGAVAAITLGTLWQKRTGADADLLATATLQFVGACLVAVPLALLSGDGLGVPLLLPVWLGMAWSVLVSSVAGILLLLVLIRRGAVAGVSALLFLVPPVSAAMAYLMFGEALTGLQIAGMAVAAVGVAVANRG